nr:hypothetical protein [Tanacetum cinerariifolium]
MERSFLSQKEGGGGRGVKEKQHGLASNTAKDTSVTLSTIDEHVNTPSINLEKPLEPNMGDQINDTTNVEVLATSNSTPITSASISEVDFVYSKVKSSQDRLDAMMENGLWFIRNNLYILKKWNQDVNLQKEDVGNVPVWVKLHGVPMTAFSEDAESSYARAMIELRANGGIERYYHGGYTKTCWRGILDSKLKFMDDDGNPLVPMGNVDSDSEMEVVFDETTNLMASTSFKGGSDRGNGTNSPLE